MALTNNSESGEKRLFLKRWLSNPLQLGAIVPSSAALSELVARNTRVASDQVVVELGGGTGRLTRGLLAHGVPADRLYSVELDPELCAYLKKSVPEVHVLQGNAAVLSTLIPQWKGKVSAVVSGMPLSTMNLETQRAIIESIFDVLAPEGEFIQYSYQPVSPIRTKALGLKKKRIGITFKNIPPATLWRYEKEMA